MKYVPINFTILSNPANWFIVLLTVMIGSFALHGLVAPQSDNS